MSHAAAIVGLVISANLALTGLLGTCTVLSMSRSPHRVIAVGCCMLFVCGLSAAFGSAVSRLVLSPLGIGWLGLVAYMPLCAGVSHLTAYMVRRLSPGLWLVVGNHLGETTQGSAVLGIALIAVLKDYTVMEGFAAGLAAAGGYLLASALLASVHGKTALEPVPRPFRGTPIALVTLAVMALAFGAFGGAAP